MAQRATWVSAPENIFVYNPKSLTKTSDTEKSDKIAGQFRSNLAFVDSTSALFYNGRVRLTLETNLSTTAFVLLRGLIEFHRDRQLHVSFDREARSLEIDYPETDEDKVLAFLTSVEAWLKAENAFKAALRHVIEFEGRYRRERESLYASILK